MYSLNLFWALNTPQMGKICYFFPNLPIEVKPSLVPLVPRYLSFCNPEKQEDIEGYYNPFIITKVGDFAKDKEVSTPNYKCENSEETMFVKKVEVVMEDSCYTVDKMECREEEMMVKVIYKESYRYFILYCMQHIKYEDRCHVFTETRCSEVKERCGQQCQSYYQHCNKVWIIFSLFIQILFLSVRLGICVEISPELSVLGTLSLGTRKYPNQCARKSLHRYVTKYQDK